MFSTIFSHCSRGRGAFVRKALPLLLALGLVATLLSGCPGGGAGDRASLIGTWKSSFNETWIITPTTVTTDTYTGTIVNNPNFTASAGVIIIEYTLPKPKYYEYDTNPPYGIINGIISGPINPPGDFYAIYWKELTAGSVELANAWNISDMTPAGAPETTTLGEAKTKFTLDNAASWAGMYSACARN
jgi:hypothetical protein